MPWRRAWVALALGFVLLGLVLILLPLRYFGPWQAAYARPVSIRCDEWPAEAVFTDLSRQAGIDLQWDVRDPDLVAPVTLHLDAVRFDHAAEFTCMLSELCIVWQDDALVVTDRLTHPINTGGTYPGQGFPGFIPILALDQIGWWERVWFFWSQRWADPLPP